MNRGCLSNDIIRMNNAERELLARCTRGEKQAWNDLVGQYAALVYKTIRRTLGAYNSGIEPEIVDDLFQDFFLALYDKEFRKLRQFRGDRGCSLASWLRLLATRLTIDYVRRRGIQTTTHNVDSAGTLSTDPSSILAGQEVRARLVSLIGELSPQERLLLKLYYSDSLNARQISEFLEISVEAVYTQKSRVLDKLRKIWKRDGF